MTRTHHGARVLEVPGAGHAFTVDADGTMHCDVPELLRAQGLPDTPATRTHATNLLAFVARELLGKQTVVHVDDGPQHAGRQ